jgi:hypothetical protein
VSVSHPAATAVDVGADRVGTPEPARGTELRWVAIDREEP